VRLPTKGRAFISVKPKDRPAAVEIARKLHALGFELVATRGTAGRDRPGWNSRARGE